jgi:hypothetical protein
MIIALFSFFGGCYSSSFSRKGMLAIKDNWKIFFFGSVKFVDTLNALLWSMIDKTQGSLNDKIRPIVV